MIEQAKWVKDFCKKEGFNFVDVDEAGIKLPCAANKGYKEDNHTIFIKGFREGSKRISVSRGGTQMDLKLKVPIDKFGLDEIQKNCLPRVFTCAKCRKKNLNLRTQDNHKTYDCPECQEVKN